MVAELMIGLLKANLAAAAVVLLVLLLRRPVRARFGARAAYALWAAPIVAGIAVLMPHPVREAPPPRLMAAPMAAVAEVFDTAAPAVTAAPAKTTPDAAEIAFGVWLAGALGAAGVLAFHQARFLTSLGRVSRQTGRLRRAEGVGVGPALVGVIRPWIVTPSDFETRFGAAERELILAHEETHLARGDAAANALACALQATCWFNPLAHLAARAMRIDQELACDAAVIDRFPTARRAYAELLLKTQIAAQPLPLGCHWPAHAAHPLKERIQMLKSPLPGQPMRAAGLAVATALVAGLSGLAWAAQPGQPGASAVGPGPAERAEAEREFRALSPEQRMLCKPRPDRTISNDCVTMKTSNFAALPTRADMMALYPAQARRDGVEAWVAIDCDVADSGKLGECAAIDVDAVGRDGKKLADPSAYGFDRAALAAARYIQAQPEPGGHRLWNLFLGFSEKMTGGLDIHNPPVPREKLIAPPPPGAPVAKPIWVQKPTAAEMARVYPAAAAKAGDRGYATIACKFSPAGRLRDCKVVNEAFRSGFGAAALKLADSFQAKPVSGDGDQVGGGTVLIPIYFQPSARPVAAAAAPAPRISVTYAPGNAPAAPLILKPRWVYMPTAADLARFYPPEAVAQRLEGTTVLSCVVDVDGRLADCSARGPGGFGKPETMNEEFRTATLALAPLFRMQPQLVNGVETGGVRVNIPIRWALPTDPAAAAHLANPTG